MASLRALLRRHQLAVAILLAAVLCLRALIPAGYMPGTGERFLTVSVCADASGKQVSPIVITVRGDTGESQGSSGDKCPFAPLAAGALSASDILYLAIGLAFILALALVPSSLPELRTPARLLPPLRGPPKRLT